MSLFGSIFSAKSDNTSVFPWNELSSEGQWKIMVEKSYEKPRVVFKHSTRCHISRTVLREFENTGEYAQSLDSFYLLDLLSYRSVSDTISNQTNVLHQSPQVIVLYQGVAIYDASHGAVSFNEVMHVLQNC